MKKIKIQKETNREMWTVMGIFLLINFILLGFSSYSYDLFFDFSDYPGNEPPWYSIRKHFTKAIIMSFGLIPTVIFAWLFIKRKKSSYLMVSMMGAIQLSPELRTLYIILSKTSNIFDKANATTEWTTFASFMAEKNPLYTVMMMIPVLLVMTFIRIFVMDISEFKKTKRKVGI